GAADDRSLRVERPVVAEVVPEPERDGRQQQPAATRAVVAHALVAVGGGGVGHSGILHELPFALRRYPSRRDDEADVGERRRRQAGEADEADGGAPTNVTCRVAEPDVEGALPELPAVEAEPEAHRRRDVRDERSARLDPGLARQ